MTELSTHTKTELAGRSGGGMDVTPIWVHGDEDALADTAPTIVELSRLGDR